MIDEEVRDFADEQYEEWQPPAGFAPLPRGNYDLRLAKVDPPEGGEETYNPVVSIEVVDAKDENLLGRTLNFQRLWAKPYYRSAPGVRLTPEERAEHRPNTSTLLDALKAFGFKGFLRDLPKDTTAVYQLVESYVGAVAVKQRVNWSGYCKACAISFPNKYIKFEEGYTLQCQCGEIVEAREEIRWKP